jgi:hypothetical protein
MPSRPGPTIVVRKKSDLQALTNTPGFVGMPSIESVVFELDGPSRSHQLAWQSELNAYLRRCGCAAGSIVTLVSLGIAIVLIVRVAGDESVFTLAWLVLAAVLISALVGFAAKVVTLLITRAQIRATVRSIVNAA